jgi:hypothetical protein
MMKPMMLLTEKWLIKHFLKERYFDLEILIFQIKKCRDHGAGHNGSHFPSCTFKRKQF